MNAGAQGGSPLPRLLLPLPPAGVLESIGRTARCVLPTPHSCLPPASQSVEGAASPLSVPPWLLQPARCPHKEHTEDRLLILWFNTPRENSTNHRPAETHCAITYIKSTQEKDWKQNLRSICPLEMDFVFLLFSAHFPQACVALVIVKLP